MNDILPPHSRSLFVTARLSDRSSTLLTREIETLRSAMCQMRRRLPFTIEAIAVLPAKIHAVVTLPMGERDFNGRWSLLETLFARGLHSRGQARQGSNGMWQRPCRITVMTDADDLAQHVDLVHASPVYLGLCADPRGWRHSSVHRHHLDRYAGAATSAHPTSARPMVCAS